jgi:putative peptidoglycan lipid II flippase
MALTLLSRLLGIVKAKVIGSVYGSGETGDVINFTYNIPNNFRKLFAEGAMSSAYVPVFSRQVSEGKQKDSNILMDLLFTYQLLLFLLIFLSSCFFGDEIIDAFSSFSEEGIKLGGKLLPFFMLFLTFVSLGTIFSSLLQVHKNFFASSFAPIIFSLTVITGILVGDNRFGTMAMAYAVLLGGVFQFLFWYLSIRKNGYKLRLAFFPKQCEFPLVLKNWLLVIGSSLIQILGQQVSYSLASGMETGSVTAFSNATIFWQTPYGIFFTGATTVLFPLMSQAWNRRDAEGLRKETSRGLSQLATFLVPSAILIFALANECVSSILQGGAYTYEVALMTASVVRHYLIGMLFVAWYGFLQRFCYSTGRYKLVLRLSILQTALDIFFSILLMRIGIGVIALPIANNISFCICLAFLCFFIRETYAPLKDKELQGTIGKILMANVPLLIVSVIYKSQHATWWQTGSSMRNFAFACLLGIVGCAIVFVSYMLFHIPFMDMFRRKKE